MSWSLKLQTLKKWLKWLAGFKSGRTKTPPFYHTGWNESLLVTTCEVFCLSTSRSMSRYGKAMLIWKYRANLKL
eukprot:scaffold22597_cov127-Cylindrotheca_fusiformis.AAC.2